MKVARYEVPGIGKKSGPVPEGQLKSGCALNYACRISRLPRIRRPSGTRPFFVCYPGNKLPGYYREVPARNASRSDAGRASGTKNLASYCRGPLT